MKKIKRVTVLAIIVVILIGIVGAFVASGDLLMGRLYFIRGTETDVETNRGRDNENKSRLDEDVDKGTEDDKNSNWWCEEVEKTDDENSSEDGNEGEGSGSEIEESSYVYIDPSIFQLLDTKPQTVYGLKHYEDMLRSGTGRSGEVENIPFIPELISPEEESEEFEVVLLHCECLGEIKYAQLTTEKFQNEYNSDGDAFCEFMNSTEFCEEPVQITCGCLGEDNDHVISNYELQTFYDGNIDAYCEYFYPPLSCDEDLVCEFGEDKAQAKIDEVCGDLAQLNAAGGQSAMESYLEKNGYSDSVIADCENLFEYTY